MAIPLRSNTTTQGRKMAGARSLWRANGMKEEHFGRPVIGIVNSFTQFVPGHVHLHNIGQQVKKLIEDQGCFAAEFNTIAIDDGIAMGHSGMLYSLPSRELIADSVEYMCNAHTVDAMICISNCDKITPGMLMAAMRLNIPTIFVSGGPMEAGVDGDNRYDLVDAMVMAGDKSIDDETIERVEQCACPSCGSCSGMFTANSMNCLNEALGLALPGNGTILATDPERENLWKTAAQTAVKLAKEGAPLPKEIATEAKQRLNKANIINFFMDLITYYTTLHDPLWIILLSTALFFPVRKLIWVLYVRKKQKTQQSVSEEEKIGLKKRATFTAILLCIVFSYIYVKQVFN